MPDIRQKYKIDNLIIQDNYVYCKIQKGILKAQGHPQPTVPIKTDNETTSSFVNDTLKRKQSKAWDVRYHWLIEEQKKNNFKIYWDKGANNLAD